MDWRLQRRQELQVPHKIIAVVCEKKQHFDFFMDHLAADYDYDTKFMCVTHEYNLLGTLIDNYVLVSDHDQSWSKRFHDCVMMARKRMDITEEIRKVQGM